MKKFNDVCALSAQISSARELAELNTGLQVLANFAELTAKGEAEEAVKLATRSQNELSDLIRFVKKTEKIAKEIKPIYESVIFEIPTNALKNFEWRAGAVRNIIEITDNQKMFEEMKKAGLEERDFFKSCKIDYKVLADLLGKSEKAFIEDYGELINFEQKQTKPVLKVLA